MKKEELLTVDVAEGLRLWVNLFTTAPLGPEAPATYQREFLRRVLGEVERLRAENEWLKEELDGYIQDQQIADADSLF